MTYKLRFKVHLLNGGFIKIHNILLQKEEQIHATDIFGFISLLNVEFKSVRYSATLNIKTTTTSFQFSSAIICMLFKKVLQKCSTGKFNYNLNYFKSIKKQSLC